MALYVSIFIRELEPIKSVFRNGIVTAFSLDIAFLYGLTQGEYSLQQQFVAVDLIIIIAVSTFVPGIYHVFGELRELRVDNSLSRFVLLMTCVAIMMLTAIVNSKASSSSFQKCNQFQYSSPGVKYQQKNTVIIASLVALVFLHLFYGVIALIPRFKPYAKKVFFFGIAPCWLVIYVLAIIATELLVSKTIYYGGQDGTYTVIPLSASRWGLGQVMAMVMLGLPIWDIGGYYYERNRTAVDTFFWHSICFSRLRQRRKQQPDLEMADQTTRLRTDPVSLQEDTIPLLPDPTGVTMRQSIQLANIRSTTSSLDGRPLLRTRRQTF